ncbi:MAG TPA: hypothetical protein VI643_04225 [Planctomycetota bacterium]|nr:hypothetical protein [Planctomycetota bacterium]
MEAVREGRPPASAPDAALVEYAIKLTRAPWEMTRGDVEKLRAAGYSDEAVVDAAQVASFFNYINRVSDGLGVDFEPNGVPPPDKG